MVAGRGVAGFRPGLFFTGGNDKSCFISNSGLRAEITASTDTGRQNEFSGQVF
jgi:hypothetical protein